LTNLYKFAMIVARHVRLYLRNVPLVIQALTTIIIYFQNAAHNVMKVTIFHLFIACRVIQNVSHVYKEFIA